MDDLSEESNDIDKDDDCFTRVREFILDIIYLNLLCVC